MLPFRSFRAVVVCLTAAWACLAADDKLSGLSKPVSSFKLANGTQFFVVERSQSPVVSFHLRIKAGVADEPSGRGGMASLALSSFFQGSETLGSRSAAAEKSALAQAEKLFDAVRAQEEKGEQVDEVQKGRLEFQARSAIEEASRFAVRPAFFDFILAQNGALAVDLRPSADFSDIAITLPSGRAELWFKMIAGWLHAPSARFFVQSRERVLEQRQRLAQTGVHLRERAFGAPFTLHPYQAIAAGEGELSSAGPGEMLAYLKSHYVPANVTVGIVGDIAATEAKRLADVYFGKISAVAPAAPREAVALKALDRIPVRIATSEAALFVAAWPRPSVQDRSDPVFDLLYSLLAGGEGSRLTNDLMVDSKIVNRFFVNPRFPGMRYPGMFVIEGEPTPALSHEDVEAAIAKSLTTAAQNGFSDAELARARQWWRNRLLAEAQTASGRAAQLIRLHTEYGSYKVEDLLGRLEAVTSEDCKRVLTEYFVGQPYFPVLQFTGVAGGVE